MGGGGGGLNTLISFHGYVTCTNVAAIMAFQPLEAESENSLSVGCKGNVRAKIAKVYGARDSFPIPMASKHVPFVHLGTESTDGCIIKKEVTQCCVTIV